MKPLDYYLIFYIIGLPIVKVAISFTIRKTSMEWQINRELKFLWIISIGLLLFRLWG